MASFQSWLGLSGDQPARIQEPTQSHLIRTKDTPITQEIPGDLGPWVRNQGQRPNTRTKDVPSPLIT